MTLTIDASTSRWEPVFVADDVPVFTVVVLDIGEQNHCWTISPRFYDVVKEKGENLEIVFVSADKSPAEFQVSKKVQGGGWLVMASFYW